MGCGCKNSTPIRTQMVYKKPQGVYKKPEAGAPALSPLRVQRYSTANEKPTVNYKINR